MDPTLLALFGLPGGEEALMSPLDLGSEPGWQQYLNSLQPQQQLPQELRDPGLRQTPNDSPIAFEGGQARNVPMPKGGGAPPQTGGMDPHSMAASFMGREARGPSAQESMGSLLSMVPRHGGEKEKFPVMKSNPYIRSLLGL